jgi:hypothetical protein
MVTVQEEFAQLCLVSRMTVGQVYRQQPSTAPAHRASMQMQESFAQTQNPIEKLTRSSALEDSLKYLSP